LLKSNVAREVVVVLTLEIGHDLNVRNAFHKMIALFALVVNASSFTSS
jgi:hypothetical protein